MKNIKAVLICVLGVVIGFVAVNLLMKPDPEDAVGPEAVEQVAGARNSDAASEKAGSKTGARKGKSTQGARKEKSQKRRLAVSDDMFDHLTGEDRKLAEEVQNALDADDHDRIIRAARKALLSKVAEVRLNAVEALGWCGEKALPELTGALGDPDDEVRESAQNNWECALSEVEDPRNRFIIASGAVAVLADEDARTSIAGQMSNAALEYIDDEDDEMKQKGRRIEIVQRLVDIIDGGKVGNAECAKEAYNDITGNEWLGVEEAEKYVADPDNYEPPDDSDDSDADAGAAETEQE